jgi:hypothetical protein
MSNDKDNINSILDITKNLKNMTYNVDDIKYS